MHYPLGIKMTTKLNTNGAVIGQREGLSRVRLNECNRQTCNSTFDVQEFQDHVYQTKINCLVFFHAQQNDIIKLALLYCLRG
jgi:hypothetical protein